jgi:hypothetical protein
VNVKNVTLARQATHKDNIYQYHREKPHIFSPQNKDSPLLAIKTKLLHGRTQRLCIALYLCITLHEDQPVYQSLG